MKNGVDFLLRVECMTYNQAPYIKDTLDGFCKQQTTFPFLCIIADDASTDGEPEVIKKYLDTNFDKIENALSTEDETDEYLRIYARHKENTNCYFCVLLLKYNHYSIGKAKTKSVAELMKSVKYLASCEGDDYWTDPMKLQKQVDFLENNPDFSLCFHNVKVWKNKEGVLVDDFITKDVPSVTDIYDIIKGNYIHTPSVVFRNGEKVYGDRSRLGYSKIGDFPLWVLCAQYGKIKKIEECMAVYRFGAGIWSTTNDDINKLQVIIDIYENFYKYFSLEDIAKRDCYFDVNKLIVDIKRILSQLYSKFSKRAYKNNDRKLYRKYYLKAIKMYPHKTRNIKEFMADYMFPVLYSKLRKKEIS